MLHGTTVSTWTLNRTHDLSLAALVASWHYISVKEASVHILISKKT